MSSQFRPWMVMVNSFVTALVFRLAFTSALLWCLVATTHRSVVHAEGRFYCFCFASRYIRTKLHPQPPYCSEHRVEGNIRGGGVLSAPRRETSSHVLPYSPPSLSRSIGPAAASQYATSAPSPHTGQWWSAGCDETARK